MVLQVLRALFVLLMAAIGWFYLSNPQSIGGANGWLVMPITLSLGVLFVCVDILSPRRKLAVLSGTILGLMVGVAIAFALSFVVRLLIDQFRVGEGFNDQKRTALIMFLNVTIGTICCYLSISFIIQTRDDFRFIIPYVEFSRQQKGPRPMMLDTSVLIDGRIGSVARTGVIESQIIIPQFVIDELQAVADSADKLKRSRGRRGLDVLATLRQSKSLDIKFYDAPHLQDVDGGVDQKLLRLAKELNARIVTTDYNLCKVAELGAVDIINLNDLATAMKPLVLPGEKLTVRITRAGEEAGQGVGYLEDGTMVVVEQGRQHLNQEIDFTVSRALQTNSGRMIFGRALASANPA